MNFTLETILIFVAVGVGLWLLSFVVEALRPAPKAPKALSWAPDIPVAYVGVGGCKLRYIKTGRGPNLVLLHTLRTQFDLFQKVIPGLAKQFTVHALDYPGHGFSDIPKARYDTDFFVRFVEDFVDVLDLSDVTLCGVSIGGAIGLIIAGRRNPRITQVMAINPYDYAKGRGMARSSLLGWMDHNYFRHPFRRRNPHAAAKFHHYEGCSPGRSGKCRKHSAGTAEGNVSGRQSARPLSRVHQPPAQLRKLGSCH